MCECVLACVVRRSETMIVCVMVTAEPEVLRTWAAVDSKLTRQGERVGVTGVRDVSFWNAVLYPSECPHRRVFVCVYVCASFVWLTCLFCVARRTQSEIFSSPPTTVSFH